MYRATLLTLAALLPLAASASHDPPGRLAEVEVVDSDSGRVLPTYRHQGRWYVAGEPGAEYEIRIRNTRSERLLAVTSVDGVNVISGQTASPAQSGYVLGAYDDLGIEGWRKSLSRIARFYFTDLGDSYAARTGRPGNVGVIGVALYRERVRDERSWIEERQDSAADRRSESAPRAKSYGAPAAPEPQLGTGHGRNERSDARTTTFERASDRPAEIITIYYDSRRNLAAQGVIPPPTRWARRPRAEPFPAGFVPDPWR